MARAKRCQGGDENVVREPILDAAFAEFMNKG